MKKIRAIAAAVLLAVLLILSWPTASYAHHNTVSGVASCLSQEGTFSVTWQIENSESDKPESADWKTTDGLSGSLKIAPGDTAKVVTDGHKATVSMTVDAIWYYPNGQTVSNTNKSGDVYPTTKCEVPTTTTTVEETTTTTTEPATTTTVAETTTTTTEPETTTTVAETTTTTTVPETTTTTIAPTTTTTVVDTTTTLPTTTVPVTILPTTTLPTTTVPDTTTGTVVGTTTTQVVVGTTTTAVATDTDRLPPTGQSPNILGWAMLVLGLGLLFLAVRPPFKY